MDNRFISRFWENYIVKLNTYGVKPKGARWYVRHAEQYLRTFPDRRLATHTVQDVEQYLQDKGRKAGLEDWRFQQIVTSLTGFVCRSRQNALGVYLSVAKLE